MPEAQDTQDESVPYDGIPSTSGFVSAQTPSIKDLIDGVIYGAQDVVSNALSKPPANVFSEFLQGAWLTFASGSVFASTRYTVARLTPRGRPATDRDSPLACDTLVHSAGSFGRGYQTVRLGQQLT